MSVAERLANLRKIERWIASHEALIIAALTEDFRKPAPETLLSEVKLVRDEIKTAQQGLRSWARPQTVAAPLTFFGTRSQVVREPKGPALIIGAWNYPFTLSVGPCISAIAAGCTVVIKPSEKAPATSKLIADMMADLFDPAYVTVVQGGVTETQQLLDLPWGHIFFTGSKRVGALVMAAAAKHLTPVTLELGGENPVLIHRSAALKDAARQLVWGKFFNGGQTCIAPNHLFVDRAIYAPFQAALIEALKELHAAEPDALPMACMIDRAHYDRMLQLIAQAESAGANILVRGEQQPADAYIGPTIITDIGTDHPLVQEEVFGPILSLLPYDDPTTVWAQIDRQDAALALYIFARDRRFIADTIAHTTAGTTVVNAVNIQFAQPNLPFGGVGKSGHGKAHGEYGFAAFSHERTIIRRGPFSVTNLIFPPYTPAKQRLIRWVYRWL